MSPVRIALREHGLLALEGRDAAVFLNGQSTCEMPAEGRSTPGACCTPGGRMVASFQLAAMREDCLLLKMPSGVIPLLEEFLKKYIRFAKCSQRDASGEYRLLGLVDPEGAAAEAVFGDVPESPGDCLRIGDSLLLRRDSQRLECWLATASAAAWEEKLAAQCEPASLQLWQLLDIQAGVAEVCPETSLHFLPQMLNLDQREGVSFEKGCYTGQEVIARAQHRGQVKRRMHRLQLTAEDVPGASAPLYSGERRAGEVVCRAPAEEKNTWELLAVVDERGAEAGTLSLGQPESAAAKILPFSA